MSGLLDALNALFARCLHSQATMVLGRLTPEGRLKSQALATWRAMLVERKEKQAQARKVVAIMSPEGRAKARACRAWHGYAKEQKEMKGKVKNALARMTPEGRMRYAGMQAFKRRSPAWKPGPDRILSTDGFWALSTKHKERVAIFGTPEMSQGILRFAFRIDGAGAGMVVGVADATNLGLQPPLDIRAWGLHLTHGCLYTKKGGTTKGVLSTKQLVPPCSPETPEDDPVMAARGACCRCGELAPPARGTTQRTPPVG